MASKEKKNAPIAEELNNEELKLQLQRREKDLEDLRLKMKYLQADFENYRKHVEKTRAEHEMCAAEAVLRDVLRVADELEAAQQRIKDSEEKKGIGMILGNLMKALERHGVRRIEATGKSDPFLHEAVLAVRSERGDGEILEELQKGYMVGTKVLRHSKVKVSKGPAKAGDGENHG